MSDAVTEAAWVDRRGLFGKHHAHTRHAAPVFRERRPVIVPDREGRHANNDRHDRDTQQQGIVSEPEETPADAVRPVSARILALISVAISVAALFASEAVAQRATRRGMGF